MSPRRGLVSGTAGLPPRPHGRADGQTVGGILPCHYNVIWPCCLIGIMLCRHNMTMANTCCRRFNSYICYYHITTFIQWFAFIYLILRSRLRTSKTVGASGASRPGWRPVQPTKRCTCIPWARLPLACFCSVCLSLPSFNFSLSLDSGTRSCTWFWIALPSLPIINHLNFLDIYNFVFWYSL